MRSGTGWLVSAIFKISGRITPHGFGTVFMLVSRHERTTTLPQPASPTKVKKSAGTMLRSGGVFLF
jgi:hypothetical protein